MMAQKTVTNEPIDGFDFTNYFFAYIIFNEPMQSKVCSIYIRLQDGLTDCLYEGFWGRKHIFTKLYMIRN